MVLGRIGSSSVSGWRRSLQRWKAAGFPQPSFTDSEANWSNMKADPLFQIRDGVPALTFDAIRRLIVSRSGRNWSWIEANYIDFQTPFWFDSIIFNEPGDSGSGGAVSFRVAKPHRAMISFFSDWTDPDLISNADGDCFIPITGYIWFNHLCLNWK